MWCAPWRVDITHVLRSKDNRLEIDVANLWASAATQEDSKFNRTILSTNGLVLGLVLAGKYTRKRYAVVVRAADFGANEFF